MNLTVLYRTAAALLVATAAVVVFGLLLRDINLITGLFALFMQAVWLRYFHQRKSGSSARVFNVLVAQDDWYRTLIDLIFIFSSAILLVVYTIHTFSPRGAA